MVESEQSFIFPLFLLRIEQNADPHKNNFPNDFRLRSNKKLFSLWMCVAYDRRELTNFIIDDILFICDKLFLIQLFIYRIEKFSRFHTQISEICKNSLTSICHTKTEDLHIICLSNWIDCFRNTIFLVAFVIHFCHKVCHLMASFQLLHNIMGLKKIILHYNIFIELYK